MYIDLIWHSGSLIGIVAFTSLTAAAQGDAVEWRPATYLEPRAAAAMTYDAKGGVCVLFGGIRANDRRPYGDTWTWDGRTWTERHPTSSPPARSGAAVAYDARRSVVVVFGGYDEAAGNVLDDTWEWDGANWTHRSLPARPPARQFAAMAYDAARGCCVLFGGSTLSLNTRLSDTWEWNGTTWTQGSSTQVPPARFGHAMTYDLARAETVMFGGYTSNNSTSADTWTWNGAAWTQRSPPTSPSQRAYHGMVYDALRLRVLLFSGENATPANDLWSWDGSTWSRIAVGIGPAARAAGGFAHDTRRDRLVLATGAGQQSGFTADTWEWDGTAWSLGAPTTSPPARGEHALAFDTARGRTVLFGGNGHSALLGGRFDDTWEWDGLSWQQRATATRPLARCRTALAFDAARRRTVLFGGSAYMLPPLQDTWEWDGVTWQQRVAGSMPPPRLDHALTYDAARGRIVLFGGQDAATHLNDTWEWDGTTWTATTPSTRPPARWGHAMVYDEARSRVMLFGGCGAIGRLWDTWEWDGVSWTQRTTRVVPMPRISHGMTYDTWRQRVVLYGGDTANQLVDMWEWDGNDWLQRWPARFPPRSNVAAMAFDSRRGRVVLLDHAQETWEYGPIHPASLASYGQGCGGSIGTPSLVWSGRRLPWIGDALEVQLVGIAPNASAAMLLGLSRTSLRGTPLPLPLASIGMPGCTLYTSGDMAVPLVTAGGRAPLVLPLCPCPSLVGGAAYLQGLALDPAANALGVVTSDATEARIGEK